SIHRYVQLGVHIKGYYSKERQKFHREIAEVTEFYVTEDNEAKHNVLYKKTPDGNVTLHNPSKYLLGYLESQGVILEPDILVKEQFKEQVGQNNEYKVDNSIQTVNYNQMNRPIQNQQMQNNSKNTNQPQPTRQIVNNLNQQYYQNYPQNNINQMQQPVSNQVIQNQNYQNRQMNNGQQNVQVQRPTQYGQPTM
ncbi:MAG: hypothetical protein IIY05_06795, partial [Alistipes sp.]|nr:hypothetical protein [Alistipes sp.]